MNFKKGVGVSFAGFRNRQAVTSLSIHFVLTQFIPECSGGDAKNFRRPGPIVITLFQRFKNHVFFHLFHGNRTNFQNTVGFWIRMSGLEMKVAGFQLRLTAGI